MKISIKWLQKYVDLSHKNTEQIIDIFSKHIAQVEYVRQIGFPNDRYRVGKPLPNPPTGKNMQRFTLGDQEVSCFLPLMEPVDNRRLYVIKLPDKNDNDGTGTLAVLGDLGLKDREEQYLKAEDGLLLGTDASTLDYFQDVILTYHANIRSDLLGHVGVARELSAILDLPFRFTVCETDVRFIPFCSDSPVFREYSQVSLEKTESCVIPLEWFYRMLYCGESLKGLQPIEILAKYTMMELGVPIAVPGGQETMEFSCNDDYGKLLQGYNVPISSDDGKVTVCSAIFTPKDFRKAVKRETCSGLLRELGYAFYSQGITIQALQRFLGHWFTICGKQKRYQVESSQNRSAGKPGCFLLSKSYFVSTVGTTSAWEKSTGVLERAGLVGERLSEELLMVVVPVWRSDLDLNCKNSFIREALRLQMMNYEKDVGYALAEGHRFLTPRNVIKYSLSQLGYSEVRSRPIKKTGMENIKMRKKLADSLTEIIQKNPGHPVFEISNVMTADENGFWQEKSHLCIAGTPQKLKEDMPRFRDILRGVFPGQELQDKMKGFECLLDEKSNADVGILEVELPSQV